MKRTPTNALVRGRFDAIPLQSSCFKLHEANGYISSRMPLSRIVLPDLCWQQWSRSPVVPPDAEARSPEKLEEHEQDSNRGPRLTQRRDPPAPAMGTAAPTIGDDSEGDESAGVRQLPSLRRVRSIGSSHSSAASESNEAVVGSDGEAAVSRVAEGVFTAAAAAAGEGVTIRIEAPRTPTDAGGGCEPDGGRKEARVKVVAPGWEISFRGGESLTSRVPLSRPEEGVAPPTVLPKLADEALLSSPSPVKCSSLPRAPTPEHEGGRSAAGFSGPRKNDDVTLNGELLVASREGAGGGKSDIVAAVTGSTVKASAEPVVGTQAKEAGTGVGKVEQEGAGGQGGENAETARGRGESASASVETLGLFASGEEANVAMKDGGTCSAACGEEDVAQGYRGDAAYAGLLIAEHLELFFRQQVREPCVTYGQHVAVGTTTTIYMGARQEQQ